MKKQFKKLFSDKIFYKTLFILALPLIIQNLLMTSLNMADTIMVGALGDKSIAAVGIGNQVTFLIQLFMIGIAGGSSVFIAQFWGKKDSKNIKKVLAISIIGSVIISFIGLFIVLGFSENIAKIFSKDAEVINITVGYLKIVCFSYIGNAISFSIAFCLRSIEDTKTPMIVSFIAVITNIILNYILIFGKLGMPFLGTNGSAVATFIARTLECVLIIIVAAKNETIKGKIKEYLDFDFSFVKKVYIATIPVLLNEICWGLGNFLYSVAYGQIGTTAMASVQICNNIQNIFMVLCMGMASASMVMIGNKIGAGEEEKAKEYGKNLTILACLIGIVLGVIVIFSSNFIISFFNVSNEVKEASIRILNIFIFMSPVRMMNLVIIIGVLRGGGDAGYALKCEGIPMWLVGVPLAFIGAVGLGLPVHLVVLLVSLEEVIKVILCLLRLKSGKWTKSLVKDIEIVNA